MKNGKQIGNNGNQLIEVLHSENLLADGQNFDQIAELAKPYMIKPHHLLNDDLWEDVAERGEELGYKFIY